MDGPSGPLRRVGPQLCAIRWHIVDIEEELHQVEILLVAQTLGSSQRHRGANATYRSARAGRRHCRPRAVLGTDARRVLPEPRRLGGGENSRGAQDAAWSRRVSGPRDQWGRRAAPAVASGSTNRSRTSAQLRASMLPTSGCSQLIATSDGPLSTFREKSDGLACRAASGTPRRASRRDESAAVPSSSPSSCFLP